jgi:protein-arginine kinase activator protein McsA
MFGDKEVVNDLSNLKKEELKKRLKKALNTESYEEAERIKKELLKYDN